MSKHRRLLKTNNFQWIRILLCIVPLIVPNRAKFTYDEAKFNIFHQKSTDFETKILESLQTTRNFFGDPNLRLASLYGLGAGIIIPPLSAPTAIIFVLHALLSQESDWRGVFSNAIARETKREIAAFAIQSMDSKMKTIGKIYHRMTDNSSDVVDRKMIAYDIYSKVDGMLNLFDRSDSLFKNYPLLATPLLIHLAQLIVFFDPVAKQILKGKVTEGDLSCMMSNILIDYRPRAVNDRMEKLHSEFDGVPMILSSTMQGPYQKFGYSVTIPSSFRCEKCSDKSEACLIDDFGDSYEIMYKTYTTCVQDYGLFVRYRVEELYPDDLINELENVCSNAPKATGFGWLTIKLKHLRARGPTNRDSCDVFSQCDSYVKLFIDGKPKLKTAPRPNTVSYDVGVIYTSPKIIKKALVKIEVWDQNDVLAHTLLLRREGNVDSFLSDGYMDFKISKKKNDGYDENHLDTISFWQDEYNY